MTVGEPRRRSMVSALIAAFAIAIGTAPTTSASFTPGVTRIALRAVVSGLSEPVFVTSANDRSGRLFVVERGGRVRIVRNASLLPTPFLDIAAEVRSTASEQGLLGLAFHPSFTTNHKLYASFTTAASGALAVNEYQVTTNADVVSTGTGRRLITISHPTYANHNGGMLAFGPDGYLYIGTGDGGSSGDPNNNAQNINSLLGKLLRINVNTRTGTRAFGIPSTNPYVGKLGLDEIFARGLRNPWRFSFDSATGDLWIGDVGQNRYEEIDRSTRASGGGRGANYGWRVMEGRQCFNPPSGCNTAGKVLPIVTYDHGSGCSVTGGYVYRSSANPSLQNAYVFGDFCSGRIWAIRANSASPASKTLLLDTTLSISSFGRDEYGGLFVVDFSGGALYRIIAA